MSKIILPVIRRVMPSVIANQIIGVQPMPASIFSGNFKPPSEIVYKGNLIYEFYCDAHPEILEWLKDDCVWMYVISTRVSLVRSLAITTISFEDVKGAIEFKVRF